jgi:hypothetical protein
MNQTQAVMADYRPNLRVKPRTFTITDGDFSTVQWIGAALHCSNSEAVRTAIRAYAAHLAYLEQRKNKSSPE